ncbi:MAG: FAD-dependent oxidoreductase [bacterium]
MSHDVLVVGAGLAGLRVADLLEQKGLDVCILEAEERIGGRIQTDEVDGFLLDRGFQVFLPHYPAARNCFDYPSLDLCFFDRSARLCSDSQCVTVASPFHHPIQSLASFSFFKNYLADFIRMGLDFFSGYTQDPSAYACRFKEEPLRSFFEARFSAEFTDTFLGPFFRGILSDSSLQSSSRLYYFYMLCFIFGGSAVPRGGMHVLVDQLFQRLSSTQLYLNEKVLACDKGVVKTVSGHSFSAKQIVFTCPHACLAPDLELPSDYSSLCTYYFSVDTLPYSCKSLILSSKVGSLINHVAIMSHISSAYAKKGELISVTVLGQTETPDVYVEKVQRELAALLELESSLLTFIKAYPIKKVLPYPQFFSGRLLAYDHAYIDIAGDWCYQGSIHGALYSAECCAERVYEKVRG